MGGALVSCRPVPSLRFQSPSPQLISTEEDAKADSQGKSFYGYVYDHKDCSRRLLETCYDKRRDMRSLGCAKRVVGGAFSEHEDIFTEGENTIITRFIEAKNAYSSWMGMSISGGVRLRRAKMQKVVQPVIDAIRETFLHEIDLYLKHFAGVLSNRANILKWNLQKNNCQHFNEMLLKDLSITLFLHRVPKGFFDNENLRKEKIWPHPRYCLSFGADIDTPIALLRPQTRSIIWNFYHKKRDYCDIIEFGEMFRTKLCEMPTESWEVLDGIDDGDTRSMPLVDALWSIPRDSISILQTHLLRHSFRYSTEDGKALSELQWYENRLRIFHQLDVFLSLSGALVKTLLEESIEKQHLLPKATFMNATTFGTLHATEKFRTPRVFGYELPIISFLSGRERDWNKRAIEHNFRKLRKKVS
ncbi:hypothetical protein K491DRAFT_477552 [Lophiostoma macrostomum CBS 122681]|uniref:Uncharacterized protein n=1 Tax=Lophiostoma macrostomum CBS 122681 TaxID=1314788 RepID=A0A6A6TPL8_9PLEO|nr:hypothetical protein K491DRAFT_477552 [Lophiostoma macrostomum CBS 122681]